MFSSFSFKKSKARDSGGRVEKNLDLMKYKCEIVQNEVIKVSETPCFVPTSYGDRFISRRYTNIKNQEQNFIYPRVVNRNNQRDNDILCLKNLDGYWRQHELKKCLESNFKNSREKFLIFHDLLTKEMCKKYFNQRLNVDRNLVLSHNVDKFDWPCTPRRKPIAVTEISHIIKNYAYYSHLNVLSWSKTGNLAASFGEDLVLWIPKGKSLLTYRIRGITCLAYNYSGKYLAVGTKSEEAKPPEIQVWDVSSDTIAIFVSSFQYSVIDDEIRCLVWDPKNIYVVSGMLRGSVYIHELKSSLEITKELRCKKHCVKALQFSANLTYLAASDDAGNVFVWNFESFKITFHWSDNARALIAWHPWKESYLVISTTIPASICLIDMSILTMVAYYNRDDKFCRIDAISFNPKSAELVVSLSMYEDDYVTHEILVLAALDRVVDLMNIHDGCVNCLMWNSDGTMLATAGDDDMLNIWNFFSNSQNQREKTDRKKKCTTSKLILGNPSLLR